MRCVLSCSQSSPTITFAQSCRTLRAHPVIYSSHLCLSCLHAWPWSPSQEAFDQANNYYEELKHVSSGAATSSSAAPPPVDHVIGSHVKVRWAERRDIEEWDKALQNRKGHWSKVSHSKRW